MGGGRLSFICAPSTSRRHADERAFHLLLDALNGAAADAALARHIHHLGLGIDMVVGNGRVIEESQKNYSSGIRYIPAGHPCAASVEPETSWAVPGFFGITQRVPIAVVVALTGEHFGFTVKVSPH